MEKIIKLSLSLGVLFATLLFVFLVIIFFPFLWASRGFIVDVNDRGTIVRSADFGIEFNISDACRLKNQYGRYHENVLWDAVLVCDRGDAKNMLHLFVTDNSDGLIMGLPNHNGVAQIYNDETIPARPALRILSADKNRILIIGMYGNPQSWADVKTTIGSFTQ